jgi:hypothetical protein
LNLKFDILVSKFVLLSNATLRRYVSDAIPALEVLVSAGADPTGGGGGGGGGTHAQKVAAAAGRAPPAGAAAAAGQGGWSPLTWVGLALFTRYFAVKSSIQ